MPDLASPIGKAFGTSLNSGLMTGELQICSLSRNLKLKDRISNMEMGPGEQLDQMEPPSFGLSWIAMYATACLTLT